MPDAEDEEHGVLLRHRAEERQGIVVAIFSVVDDHHPLLPEAAPHQLEQELAQQLALPRLRQRLVARAHREAHVEGLIEGAEELQLAYTTQSGDQLVLALLRRGGDVEAQRRGEDQVDQAVGRLR